MAPILHSMRVLSADCFIVVFLASHRLISLLDVYDSSRTHENDMWHLSHSSADLISRTRGLDAVHFIGRRGKRFGDGFGAVMTIPLDMAGYRRREARVPL